MLNYSVLAKRPSVFRNFSGLEVPEFDALNLKIRDRYPVFEQKRLAREDRKRRIGAGHPFNLSLTDRFLMLLVYYHLYLSSNLMAYLFNLSQTNVLKDIRKLEPLVSEVLPLPKTQNERVRRLQTLDEVEAMFPGFKAFLDATEQEIPMPRAKLKRKTHYSGKKKKHTVKTQITVNKNGLIVHKAGHVGGSTHDYALFKRRHPRLPDDVLLNLDLGYVGVKADYPNLNCVVPFKRKNPGRGKRGARGPELSACQKTFNKKLSAERMAVEHTFSRLKKFRIWADEFRNRLKHYDIMTDIVSGLINYRTAITATT